MESPKSTGHVPPTSSPLRTTSSNTSTGGQTPPLKITKRESLSKEPATKAITRRQSTSYNHVRNHSLVSNSPFIKAASNDYKQLRNQLGVGRPTKIPTARKVSGERKVKRTVENLHDAAGELALGFKRRQSKGLQGLAKQEAVTRSPFKRATSVDSTGDYDHPTEEDTSTPDHPTEEDTSTLDHPAEDDTFTPDHLVEDDTSTLEFAPDALPAPVQEPISAPPTAPPSPLASRALPQTPVTTPSTTQTPSKPPRVSLLTSSSPSPRPSLVSKRLHGPRSPTGSPASVDGSGKRQRRKTVTFDERCDVLEFDRESTASESVFESEPEDEADLYPDATSPVSPEVSPVLSDTLDGLVESILDEDVGPSTPTSGAALAPDTDVDEAGIPYGRSHHAERFQAAHADDEEPLSDRESSFMNDYENEISREMDEDQSLPSTPRSLHSLEIESGGVSLDHSDYVEQQSEVYGETAHFPHPPSPTGSINVHEYDNDPIPQLRLSEFAVIPSKPTVTDSDDPFLETPAPIGTVLERFEIPLHERLPMEKLSPMSFQLPGIPKTSPLLFGDSMTCDLPSVQPPSLTSSISSGSANGRTPRISREEVKRRLLKQRGSDAGESPDGPRGSRASTVSPDGSPFSGRESFRPTSRNAKTLPSPPGAPDMSRGPFSHTGVTDKPHTPTSREPPRPSLRARAATDVSRTNIDFIKPGFDLGNVTSALDRLMIGVERGFAPPAVPVEDTTTDDDTSLKGYLGAETTWSTAVRATPVVFAPTDASVTETEEEDGPATPLLDRHVFTSHLDIPEVEKTKPTLAVLDLPRSTPARPLTPTGIEAIRAHEALILAKRREQRAKDGRPIRRRSRSTGDADDIKRELASRHSTAGLPDMLEVLDATNELPLSDSIDRELNKITGRRYRLREHANTIYASADDKISHVGRVGDIDSGKAWRAVRRPSDMNEYSQQIKEFRSQEKPGKSNGKVFVKVLGVKNFSIPIPNAPTFVSCTLNNGIHFVTTPEVRLSRDTRIDQEFELIEHGKLEFTLTIKVRKDPHILAQMQAARPPAPPVTQPSTKGGMLSFFTPRKNAKKKEKEQDSAPSSPVTQPESIGKYVKQDGALGRTFVSFKDIVSHCDTKLFETAYPLIGQWSEGPSRTAAASTPKTTTQPIGEMILQVFRLPPLPGIPPDELPQSLEECHRGLRHLAWHKVTYHQGVLTQNGGDCSIWRRRHFRMIGANLIAFNDVTKKPTATIDLRKLTALEDDQDLSQSGTPGSRPYRDRDDGMRVERSFRLVFGQEYITFFADADAEKAAWLKVLRAMIGRIPPNPLWAELVWQRQEELSSTASPRPKQNAKDSSDASTPT